MNRFRHVLVLTALACIAPRVNAQRTPPGADADRPAVLRAAREVMRKARYCAFITLGEDGQPQARVVDPLGPDDEMTVWVGTNARTRKVAQIGKDPRVTLFYFDAAAPAYVTLIGKAVVSSDPAEKAKHWKNEWAPFYKDQYRDPDFVLLKVKPRRLEIVSQNHGLINDPQTWRPVAVEFPEASVASQPPRDSTPASFAPPWNAILGEWTGEGAGSEGAGSGKTSFQYDLGKRVIVRRNVADYPAAEGRAALHHEDLLVVYSPASPVESTAIYFDNEGHVISYTASWSADGKVLTFVSPPAGNGPRYRLTYTFPFAESMSVLLEIAPPGSDAFKRYVEGVLKRVPGRQSVF